MLWKRRFFNLWASNFMKCVTGEEFGTFNVDIFWAIFVYALFVKKNTRLAFQ
jgi:hypothetical protein